ncbi:unnamed protein product [Cyprideis torosa]|uniref:Uncharacterized protein n=1 Tax=Cyprideis torosa TaxID=163714 RepID=A0A7R8WLV8_9CRUS|nr:unnamed protein product [Cyprideis torosa]CAG0902937.1 unnamed protein product [Cyprideis torosa]
MKSRTWFSLGLLATALLLSQPSLAKIENALVERGDQGTGAVQETGRAGTGGEGASLPGAKAGIGDPERSGAKGREGAEENKDDLRGKEQLSVEQERARDAGTKAGSGDPAGSGARGDSFKCYLCGGLTAISCDDPVESTCEDFGKTCSSLYDANGKSTHP